jgi:hypothetical protein
VITRHCAAERLARHRHAEAYVAVVLAGAYLEAGDGGRVYAHAGTLGREADRRGGAAARPQGIAKSAPFAVVHLSFSPVID